VQCYSWIEVSVGAIVVVRPVNFRPTNTLTTMKLKLPRPLSPPCIGA
jgi:hypothetical protein